MPKPFLGYTVYKQWHKKSGRWLAILYHRKRKTHTSMSWARYKMSVHLGRRLDPDLETVDHKDDDKTNDKLSNLQLMPRLHNIAKYSGLRLTTVKLVCPVCSKEFVREKRQTHLGKGGNPSCCSRKCAIKRQFNK